MGDECEAEEFWASGCLEMVEQGTWWSNALRMFDEMPTLVSCFYKQPNTKQISYARNQTEAHTQCN